MQRALVIVSLAVSTSVMAGTTDHEPRRSARPSEVVRLRAHFDAVDGELRSRDITGLTAAQQSRRTLLTRWLRDYRNAGSFPVNDRVTAPTPFFRDSNGTLCAMAYLIQRSGRSDIVDKVEATRNNAYIAELADDPALIAWLDSSGLSVPEAARIQPAYRGDPDSPRDPDGLTLIVDYNVSPLLLGGASLATAGLNMVKPSYASGLLGIVAGAVTIGVTGKYAYDNSRIDRGAGFMMGLGGLSAGAGVHGLLETRRNNRSAGRLQDARSARSGNRVSMTIIPDFDLRASDARMGLRVAGKF